MPDARTVTQLLLEVDEDLTSRPRRISQLLLEVDEDLTSRPRRISQLLLEVDILPPSGQPTATRTWGIPGGAGNYSGQGGRWNL